jgi:alpha-1,2-mannosyltransferase
MELWLILVVRVLGSLLTPIPDCDEVFNYWEPIHFLVYGKGQQTWEYSPEYALRSIYIYYYILYLLIYLN